MQLKHGLVALALLAVSSVSLADQLSKDLAAELTAQSSVVKTPYSVFTYNHVAPAGSGLSDLSSKAASFFDLNAPDKGTFLPGFYAAFDPYITAKTYGGANFNLKIVHIPAGFKVLRLTTPMGWKNPRVANELEDSDEGCGMPMMKGDSSSAMQTVIGDRSCRKTVGQVLKALAIDAIDYSWVSAKIPGCNASAQHALIILSAAKLNEAAISSLDSNIPSPDPSAKDRASIELLWRKGGIQSPDSGLPLVDLWPQLQVDESKFDPAAWAQANLLDCQK